MNGKMKRVVYILVVLLTNVCMVFGQNPSIVQDVYKTLVTWFNPHMGNAYMHYPLLGSAQVDDYTVKKGKLISYVHRNIMESNGWDNYIATEGSHHIQYSDSMIIVSCKHSKIGDRTGIRDTTSHSHSYSIADISFKNDSTYMVRNNWILTADEHHWSNRTENENDLWNIEVDIENGFPVRIKRGTKTICFKYLKFDKFGNWIEREIISDISSSEKQIRTIVYSCELCAGKGYFSGRCMKCYGTGRCPINLKGHPDEAVGMCPQCGGSGKGVEKCKQCS